MMHEGCKPELSLHPSIASIECRKSCRLPMSSSLCEGQFKNDKKDGSGVYHYPSGAKYTGQWVPA